MFSLKTHLNLLDNVPLTLIGITLGVICLLILGLFLVNSLVKRPEKRLESAKPVEVPTPEPTLKAPREKDDLLRKGLSKTQQFFLRSLEQIFTKHQVLDLSALEELEDVLLRADVGVHLTTKLLTELRLKIQEPAAVVAANDLKELLQARLLEVFTALPPLKSALLQPELLRESAEANKPYVILFVGVNGVGKTTSIGKLATRLAEVEPTLKGRIMLAAGDTFRAAASEQLAIWATRSASNFFKGAENSDPASVVYSAIMEAKKSSTPQIVLADTAGRLHTKTSLMDEIKKMQRAATKAEATAPAETWLVVDATTGQNALQQAREFHQALGLTGIILTKLDGTAKGGVIMAIAETLKLPVGFVGVGETAQDLRPFKAESFVEALFKEQSA